MKPLAQCRLYTFIDTAWLGHRSAAWMADQLCQGGSDLIQLRAKGKTVEETLRLAFEIQPILKKAGVGFVLNDDWEMATGLQADICHLGQEDFFINGRTLATQLPGASFSSVPMLGLSTHAPAQAISAIAAKPDYIAIGPVYATPTKPQAPAVTLEYVKWAAANVPIPWFAIGGINLANVSEVLAAGATRVCVVSAILQDADPASVCRQFKRHLDK